MGQACSTCAGNDQNEIETKVTHNVAQNKTQAEGGKYESYRDSALKEGQQIVESMEGGFDANADEKMLEL